MAKQTCPVEHLRHALLRLSASSRRLTRPPWLANISSSRSATTRPSSQTPCRPREAISSDQYSKFFHLPRSSSTNEWEAGKTATFHGFLKTRRVLSSNLIFADVVLDPGPKVQVKWVCKPEDEASKELGQVLRSIPCHSPVSVSGVVTALGLADMAIARINVDLETMQPLNLFPKNIIVAHGVQFPLATRHLAIRFDRAVRNRLDFRNDLTHALRQCLVAAGMKEYETPVLFKPTPEGAREFLVPTRHFKKAYALPQSPQQYKQILMASGITRYYQFARCFRDEDLRADRQPEFTQLDLEMSFASSADVMTLVEKLVTNAVSAVRDVWVRSHFSPDRRIEVTPLLHWGQQGVCNAERLDWPEISRPFPHIKYEDAMNLYGSDKPDLRNPLQIRRLDDKLPKDAAKFTALVTDLQDPILDAFRFRPAEKQGTVAGAAKSFGKMMDTINNNLMRTPDGAPTMLTVDSARPLMGLSSLGFETFAALTSGAPGLEDFADLQHGDVLFLQARKKAPFQGESATRLGKMRRLVWDTAQKEGLVPRDDGFSLLWVTDFPMFQRADPDGAKNTLSATHHPFTAPLTEADFELLATDPLKARADNYDLVLNGVELGGGSRRIHVESVQRYILEDILKMDKRGVHRFSHLLEALRAGCPPHAGFALGLDRFVALLTGTNSIRDVIAFPKMQNGEDAMVKSPGRVSNNDLRPYHLRLQLPESLQKTPEKLARRSDHHLQLDTAREGGKELQQTRAETHQCNICN